MTDARPSAIAKPLICFAAMGLFWGAFGGFAPVLKCQAEASDGAFGLALLVASFGALLAMLTAPRLDRLLGRNVLPALTGAMALVWVAPPQASSAALLAGAMLLAAVASGTLDVVMNARLSQIEADENRSVMNAAHGLFSLAYGCSALGAGFAREAGWPPALYFAALTAVVLLAAPFTRQRPRPPIAPATRAAQARGPLIWAGGAVILIGFMAEQATEGWSALHLERAAGAGAMASAIGPALLGFTMAAGRFSGQYLVTRMSEVAVIRLAGAMAAAGAGIAALSATLVAVYAGFALLGLGISVIAPMAFALVGRRVSDAQRTQAVARISIIGYSGFFFGPPLMGFLAEWGGLTLSFATIALLLALLAGPLVGMLRRG